MSGSSADVITVYSSTPLPACTVAPAEGTCAVTSSFSSSWNVASSPTLLSSCLASLTLMPVTSGTSTLPSADSGR